MPKPTRRDRWRSEVARTPVMPPACRLFLVSYVVPAMNAHGVFSIPRKRLAALAQVSERRVTTYLKQAKEAGYIIVVSPGYRTMTAVYQGTFPDAESGNSVFSQSDAKRGNTSNTLSGGTECSRFPGEKGEQSVPTTSTYVLGTKPKSVSGTPRLVPVGDAMAMRKVSTRKAWRSAPTPSKSALRCNSQIQDIRRDPHCGLGQPLSSKARAKRVTRAQANVSRRMNEIHA